MEHVKITDLGNGYVKLIPDEGYMLMNGDKIYSEAVVNSIKGWKAVKK